MSIIEKEWIETFVLKKQHLVIKWSRFYVLKQ